MLEMIMDKHLLFVLMVLAVAVGLASKCVVSISLKKLVKAAGNMGKSNHGLIRLIRAKYEHACMISDKVPNSQVFVERYMHEYKVLGVHFYKWRRWEQASAWVCLGIGLLGAAGEYKLRGMNEAVLQNAILGAFLGLVLFLLRAMGDEEYGLKTVRTYIVDYLENVCARKYERTDRNRQQEQQTPEKQKEPVQDPVAPIPKEPVTEPPSGAPKEDPIMTAAAYTEPTPVLKVEEKKKEKGKKAPKEAPKEDLGEVRIRAILEEFLA